MEVLGMRTYYWELITNKMNFTDMPYQVRGKNRVQVLKYVKSKMRKGEKIVSLVKGF